MGGIVLDRTDDFQKFADQDWTQIKFLCPRLDSD